MLGWLIALIVSLASCIIILIILLVLIQRRFFVDQQVPTTTVTTTTTDVTSTQTERRSSYQHLFRRGTSTKSYFNWADHPSLINEAVETGWSRFAFMTSYAQTPSARPSLFGSLRIAGDYYYCRDSSSSSSRHLVVEESWEIGSGAVDFMQKLHFKTSHGLNGTHHHPSSTPKSTVRMSLPLPGPPMVDSFPQEAYFEISVLSSSEVNDKNNGIGEEEKSKLLIKQSYKSSSVPSSAFASVGGDGGLFHVTSSRGGHVLAELRRGRGGGGGVKMTIGLSVGGLVSNRVPGSYAGSIGFNSDGSVFLSGMKLVFESEKEDWAKTGKVIGCGFDPRKKKVYFTVDSELVHVIHCKSEDFGMPLYPIITSSIDITLLVNLGQSSFNYAPPNAARTPNPCFICPIVNSSAAAALGYEDSRELFSMGRRLDDDEWLSHSATTKSTFSNSSEVYCNNMRNSMVGENEELETEFFEIVLDNKGR